LVLGACGDDGDAVPFDPSTAPHVSVDRFSEVAGTLFVRDSQNGLPAANEAIDFDVAPFITQGLSPNGDMVEYYNFDVMPLVPAPIYVLFRAGEDQPVSGQLNIIDDLPGEDDYSDFWHVHKVTVPSDYVANSVASLDGIMSAGYSIEATDAIVNCPVVPDGSVARKRLGGGNAGLVQGWYQNQLVSYFSFEERALTTSPASPTVPLSPIYVTFNVNPDQEGGGPGSGFVTEDGSEQTHNVVATVPDDAAYSPLWVVNVYDNVDFDAVSDLTSAMAATLLASAVAMVNCPIVDAP